MSPLLPGVDQGAISSRSATGKWRALYSLTSRDEMQNCRWLKPLLVAQIELPSGRPTGT